MKNIVKGFILLWTTMALFGCGGGGGGSTVGEGSKPPVGTTPTTAVVKLSAETLPAGTSLSGLGLTLNLPAGVTVKTDAAGVVAPGTVAGPGGTASTGILAEFTPAAPPAQAKLALALTSAEKQGLGIGEFATVTCDVAPGTTPSAADFTITEVQAVDIPGNKLSEASASGLSIKSIVEFK